MAMIYTLGSDLFALWVDVSKEHEFFRKPNSWQANPEGLWINLHLGILPVKNFVLQVSY